MELLVSVIVPIYNVEKELERCIKSLLSQTYKNIEIILVNDGSTDSCIDICNDYAKKDNRIRVIDKKNGGLSSARNVGIEMARGDYLLFVDSDDYIAQEMISELILIIQRDNVECSMCSFEYVNNEGEKVLDELSAQCPFQDGIIPQKELFRLISRSNLGYWYYVVAWNKLYKKEIFNDLRYPKGKLHEDEFLIHHIFSKLREISVSKEKMYFYVQRENSIMSNVDELSIRRLDAVEAYIDRFYFFKEIGNRECAKEAINDAYSVLYYFIRKSSNESFKEERTKNILKTVVKILFLNWNLRGIKLLMKYISRKL